MMEKEEAMKLFPWMAEYPNMLNYVMIFGADDLIPIPWYAKDTGSAEKIYKKCVSESKTWRVLLNIKADDEAIL